MNTRLQVEHPVTECITGLDLVEWQLRVAAGEAAADAGRGALQRPRHRGAPVRRGPVRRFRAADRARAALAARRALRPGVRIDSGIAEGGQVTPFYDSMVAKLIAHGRDRTDAIRRLTAAIEDAPLVGLSNNGRFLRDLLAHPAFREARMHTTLIDDWATQGEPLLVAPPLSDSTWRLAAAVLATRDGGSRRPASVAAWDLTLQAGDERRVLRVWPQGQRIDVTAGDSTTTIELGSWVGHRLRYADQGVQHDVVCVPDGDALHVVQDGTVATLREVSPGPSADTAVDPRLARAPVAGTVAAISVAPGDLVEAGQQLVCVEAMKMEMWLVARSGGRVRAVHVELSRAWKRRPCWSSSRSRRRTDGQGDRYLRADRRAHESEAAPGAGHARADGRRGPRCYNAGASAMHVHLRRQEDGAGHLPSWDPDVAETVVNAIREACPGVIINLTTGVIGNDLAGPLACIRRVRPEIAACNAGSLNYLKIREDGSWAWPPMVFDNPVDKVRQFLDVMAECGTHPEFECFDVGIVRSVGMFQKARMFSGCRK